MQIMSLNFICFMKTMVVYPQADIQIPLIFKREGFSYCGNVFHPICGRDPISASHISLKRLFPPSNLKTIRETVCRCSMRTIQQWSLVYRPLFAFITAALSGRSLESGRSRAGVKRAKISGK